MFLVYVTQGFADFLCLNWALENILKCYYNYQNVIKPDSFVKTGSTFKDEDYIIVTG